jgi:hydroxypyruvate reductase
VLAVGKAAAPMAVAASAYCAAPREGFVLTREGHLRWDLRERLWGFESWEAGHPLPDQRGLLATQRLLEWLEQVKAPRHLLVLLSGGASSLLVAPAPPLNLEDLRAVNQALLSSGLPIERVNVVRKHLSLVKGGGLGTVLAHRFRRVTQLVYSDVVASQARLDLVGSGPTLADPSTVEEARGLLGELADWLLPELLRRCQKALRETPKHLDLRAELLADHRTLAALAREALGGQAGAAAGWPQEVAGDVEDLARGWSGLARRLQGEGFRGVLVASGEPTVRLRSDHRGRGGRCQQLAALFARESAGCPGIALLAASSDGSDGPTPYAGAAVDATSWGALQDALGAVQAARLLEEQNSSGLLEAVPRLLLHTGPTGHNLNDLFLLSVDAAH